jgi:hypothetical protein
MPDYPPTTVRVVSIEPADETKVRIMIEMIADVHRLAEVGSELLRKAIEQVRRIEKPPRGRRK